MTSGRGALMIGLGVGSPCKPSIEVKPEILHVVDHGKRTLTICNWQDNFLRLENTAAALFRVRPNYQPTQSTRRAALESKTCCVRLNSESCLLIGKQWQLYSRLFRHVVSEHQQQDTTQNATLWNVSSDPSFRGENVNYFQMESSIPTQEQQCVSGLQFSISFAISIYWSVLNCFQNYKHFSCQWSTNNYSPLLIS